MAGNARRNALLDVAPETRGLRRLDGGVRSQIRTGLQPQFPVTGKITGNFAISGLLGSRFSSKDPCAAAVSGRFP